MTRIEQIAKKMGWSIEKDEYGTISHEYHILENFNDQPEYNKLMITKLLQAKMVEDGIQFVFAQDDEHETSATAFVLNQDGTNGTWDEIVVQLETHNPEDEPAAIFELFCKVYGIPEG